MAFGKHIEIVGLLDSGNVLYDTKTKLPVVVLNVQTLKKYLPKNTYKNITIGDYSSINVSHYLKVVTVSNVETEIPIIEVDKMTICDGDKYRNKKCVLGIINHKFENANSYDCLLHRDFI